MDTKDFLKQLRDLRMGGWWRQMGEEACCGAVWARWTTLPWRESRSGTEEGIEMCWGNGVLVHTIGQDEDQSRGVDQCRHHRPSPSPLTLAPHPSLPTERRRRGTPKVSLVQVVFYMLKKWMPIIGAVVAGAESARLLSVARCKWIDGDRLAMPVAYGGGYVINSMCWH
ncbi:hypothetical protein BBAD15_g11401 [Beauveria bassiana D1-5]|uniref:Uncharacterized protein n=1 Tax=Beauveria bassiana D1-5 TaxID=1245745 RepID=A0A0A2VBA7_BEABA|nr:hypothetical protein BBAD15_g11401 [Beauveria bassiana D1-5]